MSQHLSRRAEAGHVDDDKNKRPSNVRLALMLGAVALAFYLAFFVVVSR